MELHAGATHYWRARSLLFPPHGIDRGELFARPVLTSNAFAFRRSMLGQTSRDVVHCPIVRSSEPRIRIF